MNTPAYWNGSRWLVHSVTPLTRSQLRRIAAWLLKVQAQRRLGLKPGPVRDELDLTVRALREGRIECGLVPNYADGSGAGRIAFQSTEGTGKIITLGAQHG